MSPRLFAFCFLLFFLLSSCTSVPSTALAPAAPNLIYLRTDSSGTLQVVAQTTPHSPYTILPFSLASTCSVYRLYPNPAAALLAIELVCGDSPLLEVIGLQANRPTFQETARFLAWSSDGQSFYIKKNYITQPQVLVVDVSSNQERIIPIPGSVYDLMTLPDGRIVYSLTRGLGFGSETWLARSDGSRARQLLVEPQRIVAYLRPSPDGSRIAFILMPDSQTPFPVGELWVMEADGSKAHSLAQADAGHGYAPAWSPDGTQMAFVVRENPDDPNADLSAGALLSNVYRLTVQNGALTPVTTFSDAIVESPAWSPDGTSLFFNVRRNDTISVWFEQAGTVQQLSDGAGCCAVWVPGR